MDEFFHCLCCTAGAVLPAPVENAHRTPNPKPQTVLNSDFILKFIMIGNINEKIKALLQQLEQLEIDINSTRLSIEIETGIASDQQN